MTPQEKRARKWWAARMVYTETTDTVAASLAAEFAEVERESRGALRSLLVRACMEAWEGRGYPLAANESRNALANAIADRILGGE